MRLKDKVAIITGASSEIGVSIVKRFVEEGAKVVLLGRNLNSLEKARSEVSNKDSTVAISCDITNEAQVIQTMGQILNNYGKVDVLVNSGIFIIGIGVVFLGIVCSTIFSSCLFPFLLWSL